MGHGDAIARVSLEMLPHLPFVWRPGGALVLGEYEIAPDIASGLFRRPGAVDVADYEAKYARFVASESGDAFYGAFEALRVRWVTHPADLLRAEYKIVQLGTAHSLGIHTPDTVVSNVAGGSARPGDSAPLVVKPVRYGLLATSPTAAVAYTQAVQRDELADLAGSPVIIQSRIPAAFHLRVTTIGDESFVAGLPAGSDVDWRRDPANHQRFQVTGLPPTEGVAGQSTRLAVALKLGYTAQDWIITPEEEEVFIEANPNGQWLFLDELFGGRLTGSLATRLLQLGSDALG